MRILRHGPSCFQAGAVVLCEELEAALDITAGDDVKRAEERFQPWRNVITELTPRPASVWITSPVMMRDWEDASSR